MYRGHPRDIWVVGPGRVGRALGSNLRERMTSGTVAYIGRSRDPSADHETVRSWDDLPQTTPGLVLFAVRDDQIAPAAASLAQAELPPATALHTSGVHSSAELHSLQEAGWEVGSMAPIVSIADPVADAAKLIGAWFAVEGSEDAVGAAESVVGLLEGRVLRLHSEDKVVYHAAAVFAANYLVTLLGVAERLMIDAGVAAGEARDALGALAGGALRNAVERGPVEALSGPVSRGDVDTVRRHLDRLSTNDRRLYSVLAQETLEIALRKGLDPAAAAALSANLERELT